MPPVFFGLGRKDRMRTGDCQIITRFLIFSFWHAGSKRDGEAFLVFTLILILIRGGRFFFERSNIPLGVLDFRTHLDLAFQHFCQSDFDVIRTLRLHKRLSTMNQLANSLLQESRQDVPSSDHFHGICEVLLKRRHQNSIKIATSGPDET